ncbi:MAG: hypothetical protein LRY73_18190 [Bacillus sp. (in: Bacteria)]|nr:hypothetical protein [Bacillus sp. (in: firmicutes)]
MKKFIFYMFISFLSILGITLAVGYYTTMHWTEASFFVGAAGMIISFFFSSSGDGYSKASTAASIAQSGGHYVHENEKPKLSLNPFLIGAVVYFIVSFSFPYLF